MPILIRDTLFTYLLIFWRSVDDIGHENRKQFGHSIDACSECAIWSTWFDRLLAIFARLFYPLASYRVYNIENPQFVCAWCLFKMCVNLLDEDRFGLWTTALVKTKRQSFSRVRWALLT